MGINREAFNFAITILEKKTILIKYEKIYLIFGAPIIFSMTVFLLRRFIKYEWILIMEWYHGIDENIIGPTKIKNNFWITIKIWNLNNIKLFSIAIALLTLKKAKRSASLLLFVSFVQYSIASFLYWFQYSYHSFNYFDSNSYHSFSRKSTKYFSLLPLRSRMSNNY